MGNRSRLRKGRYWERHRFLTRDFTLFSPEWQLQQLNRVFPSIYANPERIRWRVLGWLLYLLTPVVYALKYPFVLFAIPFGVVRACKDIGRRFLDQRKRASAQKPLVK